jgi:phosphoenolpyruvate carboxykinase (ATP)
MYHFMSGYTAKIPGTEMGVVKPILTFSACFGAPFLPLHPAKYAEMLGDLMKVHDVKVWLVNTGWSGGEFGVGNRIKLKFTRAMISAALDGKLDKVKYVKHDIFGIEMPVESPGVPDKILNPRNTWDDPAQYDAKAVELAKAFNANFAKFASQASKDILAAAPVVPETE